MNQFSFVALLKSNLLLIFIFSALNASSIGQAFPKYSSEENESKTWSYTNLNSTWIQLSLAANYCYYDENRFRGCFAGLDTLAQQKSPLFRLILKTEATPLSEIIFATENLAVVKYEAAPDLSTAKLQRSFWLQERLRYTKIQALDRSLLSKEVENLTATLLASMEPLPPYKIARVLNTMQSYIYDPNTHFWPSSRYDASPVPIPKLTIGFTVLRLEDGVFIDRVQRGSKADSLGIQPGDKLISVNGTELSNEHVDVINDQIIGLKDEQTLALRLQRQKDFLSFNLKTSKPVQLDIEAKKMIFAGQVFGYLSFEELRNAPLPIYCNKIAKLLLDFDKTTRGLVLDLRNKNMDSPDFAACVTGFFLGSKKQIFTSKALNGGQDFIASTSSKKVFWKPIVILQDNRTLNTAELISGALQAYGRANVVGQNSGGRTIELVTTLTDRIERFEVGYLHYLPNGTSPQTRGLSPDFKVFRQLLPNSIETNTVANIDFGLEPLLPAQISPLEFEKLDSSYSTNCFNSLNYEKTTRALALTNPMRDFQLAAGLAILVCANKREL